MNKFKESLVEFINSLYNELDYERPYTLTWKEQNGSEYLYFDINSSHSIEVNDHDRIITKIIESNYKDSISEIYTIDTGRYYQIWLYSKEKMRKKKINKILE